MVIPYTTSLNKGVTPFWVTTMGIARTRSRNNGTAHDQRCEQRLAPLAKSHKRARHESGAARGAAALLKLLAMPLLPSG